VIVVASAVSLTVVDAAASSRFFTGVLGFREELAVEGLVQLRRDDAAVDIELRTGTTAATNPTVSFTVTDLLAEYERLRLAAPELAPVLRHEPWGERSVCLTDPNGISVRLVEWVPPAGSDTPHARKETTTMTDKLDEYVDGVFAPYEGTKSVAELRADLLADLRERFRELRAEGKDDATAFELTVDSIGDIEQTVQEVSNLSRLLERQMVTRFDASDLRGGDFAGVALRDGRFDSSALRGADFARAEIAGASFKSSDVADANFDGARLTDVTMTTAELSRASFRGSVLVRTDFSMSGLAGTRFADAVLTDVGFRKTDLRSTAFDGCTFVGVDFSHSDLRGLNLDGATFSSVKFDRSALEGVTLRGATLRDVSFRATSRKYRNAVRTVKFDGARMDKLTYAGLNSLGADLSNVTVE
jgi:uncharacterized protein YjbI with pentapeptide repeats/catechol 2,3-dioxygenase-like lactoylglutathione lyase family enzyme